MPLEAPANAFNFRLDVGGQLAGYFVEVKPPAVQHEVIEHREGGAGPAVRIVPGRVRYEPVELRWGFGVNDLLWTWMDAAMKGRAQYQDIAIIMIHTDGEMQTGRFNLFRCLPARWCVSRLAAMGQELAVESMEFRYEGLERIGV